MQGEIISVTAVPN